MKSKIESLLSLTKNYNAKLVAVSKTVDINIVNQAIEYGVKSIGENKVQELEYKFPKLKPVQKRFIGHLQTNKIKKIINIADTIDTIDSIKLANKLNNELVKQNKKIDALIQVNISEENSKSGFLYNEILENFENIYKLSNINFLGLMTIGSHTNDTKIIENDFKRTRELLETLKKESYVLPNFKELSMGMSHDYKIALDQGSTMIRVGSYIFGERIYK